MNENNRKFVKRPIMQIKNLNTNINNINIINPDNSPNFISDEDVSIMLDEVRQLTTSESIKQYLNQKLTKVIGNKNFNI